MKHSQNVVSGAMKIVREELCAKEELYDVFVEVLVKLQENIINNAAKQYRNFARLSTYTVVEKQEKLS